MITIGTRGSKLALAQAHWAAGELSARGIENQIRIIKTKGDLVQDRFDKMEGKGFFTREIEEALRQGEIDLAVHSLKDLPTDSPEGLEIKAIPRREDPYDVLISKAPLALAAGGWPDLATLTVGTSSNRRVICLKTHFPDARFVPIRGNVPTRIGKMERGEADVVVLARAGLNRLGLTEGALHWYPAGPPLMVPAPGQGALALQCRAGEALDLGFMNHATTRACVEAERAILAALQGGCQLPLGALIRPAGGAYQLDLMLGSGDEQLLNFSLRGQSPRALARNAIACLPERAASGRH